MGALADGGIDMSGADPEDHYEIAIAGGYVDLGGSAYTLTAVVKREGAAGDDNAIIGGANNSQYIGFFSEEAIGTRTTGDGGTTSTFNFATDTWVINTQMLITITKDTSGNFLFYKNGALVTPSSTSNPTNTGAGFDAEYLGNRAVGSATSDFTFDGKIYEVTLYSAKLSGGDLNDLNSHLTSKFGL